ncbi:MAG: hypothetical protein U9N44_02320 [Chloroflexota bacterium]|nr:hypothetical protein [Chloroflexota bacterium]
MKDRLPDGMFDLLSDLGEESESLGYRLYLVGGMVRDLIMGSPGIDIDLVTDGDAPKLARRIARDRGVKVTTHQRFGTAKLKLDGVTIDIATARTETYGRPGALPTVEPGGIEDDLRRRDFTINAVAVELSPQAFGRALDPYGGMADIEAGLIRILHDGSFADDATRMLRGIRYEQRLGFKFEERTERLLRENLEMLDMISGDRIRSEIEIILNEERPEKALMRADALGVSRQISPALRCDERTAGRFAEARERREADPAVYMALLACDLTYEEIDQLTERLNTGNDLKQIILGTARLRQQAKVLGDPGLKPSTVYRALEAYPPQTISAMAIAIDSEAARAHIDRYMSELRHVETSLGGDDLIRMGAQIGPTIGRMLRTLLDAKLDGQVYTREEEEGLARRLLDKERAKTEKGADKVLEEYCDICGEPLDKQNISRCSLCGRSFHMTWNVDKPVENCGQVWFDPRSSSMGFVCTACIDENPWIKGAAVDLEQPPS